MPDFEPDVEMDETDAPDDSDSPETQEVDEEEDDSSDETPDEDDDVEDDDYDEDDEEDAPAKGRSPAFDKLLAKYGGDHDKMADAYFEQANSSSKLHRELQEIKEMVSKQQEDPKKVEEFINNDPYVKEVQEEAASTQAEVQRIQQEQYALISVYNGTEKEINSLQGELKRADEVDAVAIRQELSEKRAQMKDALREFNGNKRELTGLDRTLRGINRQLREARTQAQARLDNERTARQTATATGQAASRDFGIALNSEAERYGLKPNSQQYKFVRTVIRDRLINHMSQMDPDDPAIDMAEAVEYLMGEAADNLGLKPKFQKVSNMKHKTSTPRRNATGTKTGGKKPPTDKTGKYWSPEYVAKRAERLLG